MIKVVYVTVWFQHHLHTSFHAGVAPWPQLLEQPQSVQVKQGDVVKLSCTVSGFSNVTEVLWKKNHKDIESVFGTSTREYTTRRTNLADGVFVETLVAKVHAALHAHVYTLTQLAMQCF